MVVDRRKLIKEQPPEYLLRYDESDWSGSEVNPVNPDRPARMKPSVQWQAARRTWIKQHVTTFEEFDRLYADDAVFPPGVKPLDSRDIDALLTGRAQLARRPQPLAEDGPQGERRS